MIGSWIRWWISFPFFFLIPHGVLGWTSQCGDQPGKVFLILDLSIMCYVLPLCFVSLGSAFGVSRLLPGLPSLCGLWLGVGFSLVII